MLPFGVYSIFHVATYTRTNLIPTIQPAQADASGVKKPNALAETIGNFVKQYYDHSMQLVSLLEIGLWVRLLLSAITFQKWSWLLIAVYTAFLRARFAQSSFVQQSFRDVEARIDSVASNQSVPPVARQVWEAIKGGARTFHDSTDVGKYVNGAPAQKKAS